MTWLYFIAINKTTHTHIWLYLDQIQTQASQQTMIKALGYGNKKGRMACLRVTSDVLCLDLGTWEMLLTKFM